MDVESYSVNLRELDWCLMIQINVDLELLCLNAENAIIVNVFSHTERLWK